MKKNLPRISKILDEKDVKWCLENNYNLLSTEWFVVVEKWMSNSYEVFKDHEKYLILIYLVKKTFDFYATSLIKLSWDQFFSLKHIELGKFNIIDIAKNLNIPRETTRRKIAELEKENIIKKNKSGTTVQTAFFNEKFNHNNKDLLKLICAFIGNFSTLLLEEKIIKEKIKSEQVEKAVFENFTTSWNIFFDMKIPYLVNCKNAFGDLESFHIWRTSFVSQNYEIQKYYKSKNLKVKNKKDFIEGHIKVRKKTGINAFSISNICKIPRATVIRKLNKMIRNKHLVIDDKKLYYPNININEKNPLDKLTNLHIERLSLFLSKLINLTITFK